MNLVIRWSKHHSKNFNNLLLSSVAAINGNHTKNEKQNNANGENRNRFGLRR